MQNKKGNKDLHGKENNEKKITILILLTDLYTVRSINITETEFYKRKMKKSNI